MVGRGVVRSPAPALLLEQRCLDSVAQEHVQMAFGNIQGWKHHNIPGQPVTSQYQSKKPFLVFKINLQCFSLSPLFLIFHHKKGPDSLHLYSRNLYSNMVSLFVLTKQSQVSQLRLIEEMLWSFSHPSDPLLYSSCTEKTRTGHSTV